MDRGSFPGPPWCKSGMEILFRVAQLLEAAKLQIRSYVESFCPKLQCKRIFRLFSSLGITISPVGNISFHLDSTVNKGRTNLAFFCSNLVCNVDHPTGRVDQLINGSLRTNLA